MAKLKDPFKVPQVAALYTEGEIFNNPGAAAEKVWEVIVNLGDEDAVEAGQMLLIYALGPEITDPSTGRSLGSVELVRGRGRVSYVQAKMSRVRSAETHRIPRFQQNALMALSGDQKPETIEQSIPFPFVRVGDFVRRI